MTWGISRRAGKAAFPADRRGSFFLVGVCPGGRNFSAVPAAPEKSLRVAGILPRLTSQGRGKGGERVGESRG